MSWRELRWGLRKMNLWRWNSMLMGHWRWESRHYIWRWSMWCVVPIWVGARRWRCWWWNILQASCRWNSCFSTNICCNRSRPVNNCRKGWGVHWIRLNHLMHSVIFNGSLDIFSVVSWRVPWFQMITISFVNRAMMISASTFWRQHIFACFRGWQVFSVEGRIPPIPSSIFCSSHISLLPFLSLFFSSFSFNPLFGFLPLWLLCFAVVIINFSWRTGVLRPCKTLVIVDMIGFTVAITSMWVAVSKDMMAMPITWRLARASFTSFSGSAVGFWPVRARRKVRMTGVRGIWRTNGRSFSVSIAFRIAVRMAFRGILGTCLVWMILTPVMIPVR